MRVQDKDHSLPTQCSRTVEFLTVTGVRLQQINVTLYGREDTKNSLHRILIIFFQFLFTMGVETQGK